MGNSWQINKVGLLNFWYYDEEEFHFSDGKLLLRGSNGSGKSVTMQSFIPLLLDGNKSPDRLDPFGSRARRLENYLLVEGDEDREERTAYLYMEFIKEESKKYLTIGMGLKAQRGKPLKFWGFSIIDGRRINKDFYLYKDIGDKIPLTKRELENRIGDGGMVTEGQRDYMKMVNDVLFGFDEIEEYDEMIKLLIQLRTPKLSKDFKPTVVYEIMENSLQQLSEDDLRPMSEAIENMDNIKGRLEELKESKKAAEKIKDAYDKYNRAIIYEKARMYIDTNREYEKLVLEKSTLESDRDSSKTQFEDAIKKIEELRRKKDLAKEKKNQLDIHDSMKINERIIELKEIIKNIDIDIQEKTLQLDKKKSQEQDLVIRLREYNDYKDDEIRKAQQLIDEMDELSLDFDFDEQDFMKTELERDMKQPYNFVYIKNNLKDHMEKLNKAKDILEERERYNREYDDILVALNQAREEVNHMERTHKDAEVLLSETKDDLVEKIYIWKRDNSELLLDDGILVEISRQIQNFHEESSYDDIIGITRDSFNSRQTLINSEILEVKHDIGNLENERFEIEKELEKWKNKEDIEPERTEKVIEYRKQLSERQIPHIPLYEAIDFKDNLSEETKGILEEALLDMGILDALIIPKEYREEALSIGTNMGDRYIFSTPAILSHSLMEFFNIEKVETQGISNTDIDHALSSILLSDETKDTYIDDRGEYGIGILRGKTTGTYASKYIGVRSRERFRQEQIEILNLELDDINIAVQDLKSREEELFKRLNILESEFQRFPKDRDLRVAINQLKDALFNLEKSKDKMAEKEEREHILYGKIKQLDQTVYELTHRFNLKPYLEIYKDALKSANSYQVLLYNLTNSNSKIVQNVEMINSIEDQRDDLEVDIDILRGDMLSLEKRHKDSTGLQEILEEQLKISDYEEIRVEIEQCARQIEELPKEIELEVARQAREETRYNQRVESLKILLESLDIKERTLNEYREIFIEEFKLNYCILQDLGDEYKNANMVVKEVGNKAMKDKEYYSQQLYGKFIENTQYLREYLLRIDNSFDGDSEDERGSKRLYIKGKVRGRDIDFYELLNFIKEGIEENEGLLRESDRQLFEDILVKNISKKIRAKIYHSQIWVNRMNQLMENMNTSSGLSFSLNWSNKKAESEGQLDTRELVELLKQEGNLMKESDLNRLSEHFRSKITEARRIQEDLGKSQSFHSIMREILDYRKWFEFKLYFKKTGQNKKELTNNAFYQFSGGEKAMAMYVPLFSAVYARYEGARKDCPRLISLDEAFAGVDEKNIRDMFRLLDELDLDYMINSQILWGDYDTVPSLAISELIRPDNANFVTVIRYHWNGSMKELVV